MADGFRELGWETHVVFGYKGPMEEKYRKSGHTTYVIEHKNWLRRSHSVRFLRDVLKEWRTASEFSKLLEQVAPSVVYVNTAVSLAGTIAARRLHIPCIWHLRELFQNVGGEMYAPGIAKPLVRFIFKYYSSLLVANSHSVAENLLGEKLAKRAEVLPNAVVKNFFNNSLTQDDAREKQGYSNTDILIGVPGTLRPMKGHAFLLKSIADLVRENSNIRIAITGDLRTDYASELIELVEKLGIDKNVQFTDAIDDMPNFYRACDLVCIPSKAEPFGRVVIEAFASGTPVIATSVGGMREIIDDRVNGLLVQYGDSVKLVMLINEMLENKVLREQIAVAALKCAKEEYREEIYKQKICTLVSGLVAKNED